MEALIRHLHLPCGFARMLLFSAVTAGASLYAGNGLLWSLCFGAASLLLMQIGYFGAVLAMTMMEKGRSR